MLRTSNSLRKRFSTKAITSHSVEVRDLVRSKDYDGFLCGLLLPKQAREGYFAIRALNVEVATITDAVRGHSMAGQLRLQWWREQVASLYSTSTPTASQHPVIAALQDAIHQYGLSQRFFERLINARDQILGFEQPQSLNQLAAYAEDTQGSMLYLTLECLRASTEVSETAASHVGQFVGVLNLLRGVRYHAAQNCVYLPEDMMQEHNVSLDDYYMALQDPDKHSAPFRNLIQEIIQHAETHLSEARKLRADLPTSACAAFLPTVACEMFRDRVLASPSSIFTPGIDIPSRKLDFQWELFKKSILGRF